jgi:aromatic ring-opening dioxygenase LigB subunit
VSFEHEGASGELSFESSARRGSTFTAKAEYNYNPFSDKYDKMINKGIEDVSDYEIDTSMKKELWAGTYSF